MKLSNKDVLTRGVAEVLEQSHLERALAGKKKLRIKFGADPTAPDLHLGTAVALRKLKQFQDLGHIVVFVIGDYTARIGDPSGRSKTRPMLTDEEIKKNAATYFKQVGKILDVEKTEIHYNSEWFGAEPFSLAIDLARNFTVQRILERDDFTNRLDDGVEVYVHELLYPMMQAYDSFQIKADVEIGGTDQKFNMLAGRDLQRRFNMQEQDVVTVPLLVGTDGVKKMSKSYENYIGITEDPESIFGKIMSIPDGAIDQYYALCTDEKRDAENPREAKLALGEIIVGMYHGKAAGKKAKEEFVRVVSKGGMPSEIPTIRVTVKSAQLVDLLLEIKMAESKGEARRLIEQGGVKVNKRKASDQHMLIVFDKEVLVQVGKRKYFKITR
ncbi:MAG: tyrosine--tRNA ligase [bacterium]|nr:tyrosine--tRNA ligase [bacterium]